MVLYNELKHNYIGLNITTKQPTNLPLISDYSPKSATQNNTPPPTTTYGIQIGPGPFDCWYWCGSDIYMHRIDASPGWWEHRITFLNAEVKKATTCPSFARIVNMCRDAFDRVIFYMCRNVYRLTSDALSSEDHAPLGSCGRRNGNETRILLDGRTC